MANKETNKSLFGTLSTKIVSEAPQAKAESAPKPRSTRLIMNDPSARIGLKVDGKLVEKNLYWVDPAKCRVWQYHNRRYDLLNEHRCADLITGIRSQGRQEFPAIVRELNDDSEFDYEIICGARRHWTISWLRANNYRFDFLIEIRNLTDEEAFRLSDIENRDREDISDYERAIDYKNALKHFYRNQKEMAQRLEVSGAWLSYFLDLAEIPDIIVSAYADISHIKVQHGRVLKPLLASPKLRESVLSAAKDMKAQQEELRRLGKPLLDGSRVLAHLRAAAKSRRQRNRILAEFNSKTGSRMMSVTREGRGTLLVRLELNSGATHEEFMENFKSLVESFVE